MDLVSSLTIRAFMNQFPPENIMTSDDMFILDENSVDLGVSKDKLMENAGASVARIITDHFGPLDDKHVHVFCGQGNNGGDGFVVARHLASRAMSITVYLVGNPELIATPESRANWHALVKSPYSMHLVTLKDSTQVDQVQELGSHAIIVDALLGAGIKGDLREPVASAIRKINALHALTRCPVVAVDVPSGLNMDDGTTGNAVVHATRSVTFHRQKNGMVARKEITGSVDVVPIGIPVEAEWLVGTGDVKQVLRKSRDARSVKGMNGKVLVIGGSKQYTGAPVLSALAATRCGVDLVNLCIPEPSAIIARLASPDLIVTPLDGSTITQSNCKEIEARVQWADAVLIGPGMGRDRATAQAIHEICKSTIKVGKRLVVDADALKAVATDTMVINDPNVIITPHAGEFAIIAGTNASNLLTLEQKLIAAREFSLKHRCQIVLKGPEDIVMNARRCKINLLHTPAMTVGGTGDVLAGLCVALAARYGTSPDRMFNLSCAAIHLNGLIGLAVEHQKGGPFITASMMIDAIGTVLSRFS